MTRHLIIPEVDLDTVAALDALMHTITFARDGRTWYGRKLYRVALEGETGRLTHTRLTGPRAVTSLREIGLKMIIENRPHTYEGGAL